MDALSRGAAAPHDIVTAAGFVAREDLGSHGLSLSYFRAPLPHLELGSLKVSFETTPHGRESRTVASKAISSALLLTQVSK